ncbi:DUF3574 domain-containing protein [Luteimonas aquatica]|uniref:DUF3574 domain-containing protein n=1 Tax=Luteimonas aquatica TaxID=450364 RepID=UPI001F576343|nr:DUF3574 domain-containing protein [Luteimonas aquatica]
MRPHSPFLAAPLFASLLLATLLAGGCATRPTAAGQAASVREIPGRPAEAADWIRSELYFGLGAGVDGAPPVEEAQWRRFLDVEVTPRFPDGLTVFEASGQWRFEGQATPQRERSRVLVILHKDTPRSRADIEAIRRAWTQGLHQASVLWVRQAAAVSF